MSLVNTSRLLTKALRTQACKSTAVRAFSSGGGQPMFCSYLSSAGEISQMYQRFEVVQRIEHLTRVSKENQDKEMALKQEMETVLATLRAQKSEPSL